MHYAVAFGDESDIKQLLHSRSADIDESDGVSTPLLVAIERGRSSVVELLLKSGADVDRPANQNGETPLSLACDALGLLNGAGLEARKPIVRHLLSYGANVRASDASSPLFTILKTARQCLRDEDYLVSLLLENGVEVNPIDESGQTPLHLASREFLAFIVEALLGSGANVGAVNKTRSTPLHLVCGGGRLGYRRSLEDQLLIIGHLLDYGADINAIDEDGNTPVHLLVAKSGHPSCIALLLKRGATTRLSNLSGQTPLEIAHNEQRHRSIVALLIAKDYTERLGEGTEVSSASSGFRVSNIKSGEFFISYDRTTNDQSIDSTD